MCGIIVVMLCGIAVIMCGILVVMLCGMWYSCVPVIMCGAMLCHFLCGIPVVSGMW